MGTVLDDMTLALQLAERADALTLDRFGAMDLRVDTKPDLTPVTDADRSVESALREILAAERPGDSVLGEEYGSRTGAGRYRWILDPIDGTRAFISNCFLFGTLIALERDDGGGFKPVLGCIAHAAAGLALIGHSRGTRLYAADGSQRRARVRSCARIEDATLLARRAA